jgi:hypothetical protein
MKAKKSKISKRYGKRKVGIEANVKKIIKALNKMPTPQVEKVGRQLRDKYEGTEWSLFTTVN